ncbi:deaminase [Arthrobacter sp. CAU 1506]|uniref:dihydrofolate reductase family protein n=1 Tax=Arthrobacter sp. CAU 1506 TaxID=2560052 RepID=UPI0010AC896D|nr:dihydrofolate reductase family protein [Arthrobacter sp. CAU 1506]TJY71474.1 deaminase [Arthrobacter sp. CAU 1506]
MAKLLYSAIMSLDGYIADQNGNFDWSMPDDEVHSFVNGLENHVGTYLLGRRMYEVMVFWETVPAGPDVPPVERDFAESWLRKDKVVYSRTLDKAASARTRIEREFDPEAVRRMKIEAAEDLSISGPDLASHAFRAGLVDECQFFVSPVVVGGGKRFLPEDVKVDLELLDERRFGNGVVYLRYRVAGG